MAETNPLYEIELQSFKDEANADTERTNFDETQLGDHIVTLNDQIRAKTYNYVSGCAALLWALYPKYKEDLENEPTGASDPRPFNARYS